MIVNCPVVESETETLGTRGGIIVGRDGDSASECEGSLKIHLLHPERGVVVRTVRGRRNNVANIPGYSVDTVFRVQVDGNCCWHAFPNSFRRGSPQHLEVGFDENPAPFRSVQKADCL